MAYRRVLRSEDLPACGETADGDARLGAAARATTVDVPVIRRARTGRTEVLLMRLPGGEVVAFAPHCPHQGTPLDQASLFEGCIRCPQHNYVYDPTTGANILPTRDARPEVLWRLKPGYLPIYPVEERDGWIWVSDTPSPPPDPGDPAASARSVLPAAPPSPPPAEAPAAPQQEAVTAAAGTELELTLPTQPEPAHMWKVDVTGAAVALLEQTMELEAPFRLRLRLAAREPGEATVRCAYTKPWADDPREVRTFTVHVEA